LTYANGEEIEGIWENDELRTILSRTAPPAQVVSETAPQMRFLEAPVKESECVKFVIMIIALLLLIALILSLLYMRPPLVSVSSQVFSLQRCFLMEIS